MIGGKVGDGPCYAQGFGPDNAQLLKAVDSAGEMIEKQLDKCRTSKEMLMMILSKAPLSIQLAKKSNK